MPNAPKNYFRIFLIALILALVAISATICQGNSDAGSEGSTDSAKQLNLSTDPKPILKEILSGWEFRQTDESIWTRLRYAIIQKIEEFLDWLRSKNPPAWVETGTSIIWRIIGAILLVVLLLILLKFLINAFNWWKNRERPTQQVEEETYEILLSSEQLKDLAERAAGARDYSSALAHLFRYLLVWLDEHGRISLHEVKTNREILLGLRYEDPARDVLSQIIPIFNRVRYGKLPCNQSDYERFSGMAEKLMKA
jgi:hypothetical protein